jgi:hypothetical protein
MEEPENIAEALERVAIGPKRSKESGREIEEHDLDQLIRADNHIAAKNAGRRNHQGLRFTKIVPPGCG